jgi:peroxiredoxin Q/BCP
MLELKEGQKAPDFSLPSTESKEIKLSDYAGKKSVVLYFYPKDDTPGCTKESCDFRDQSKLFAAKDAVVLGVSADSLISHEKFLAKFKLSFPLLSDEGRDVIKKYGIKIHAFDGGVKADDFEAHPLLVVHEECLGSDEFLYSTQQSSNKVGSYRSHLESAAALNPDPSLESPRSRYLSQDSVDSALRFRSSAYGRYAVGAVLDPSQQSLGLARDRGNSNDGSGLKSIFTKSCIRQLFNK